MKRLKGVCAEMNWDVENVASDGDCMFSALALQLGRTGESAAQCVRSELVGYLRSHRNMVCNVNVAHHI